MIDSSATAAAGQAEPRAHLTLVHLGTFGEPWFFGVLGDDAVEGLDVLQSAPHRPRVVHAVAVVGEDAYLGGRVGHRAELGEALAGRPTVTAPIGCTSARPAS